MRFDLSKTEAVTIDGIKWVPFLELKEGWVMRPWGGTRYSLFDWSSLSSLWVERRLLIDRGCSAGSSSAVPAETWNAGCAELAVIDEQDRKIALRRLRYVSALTDHHCREPDRGTRQLPSLRLACGVAHVVSEIIEPNGYADAPRPRTIREWYRRWSASGFVVFALLPVRHSRERGRLHS